MDSLKIVNAYNHREENDLLDRMFRARKETFYTSLKWAVSVYNGELDLYDTSSTVYIVCEAEDGQIMGAVRLLPTDNEDSRGKSYPLRDMYPDLYGDAAPDKSEFVWEASRFMVCEGAPRSVTPALFAGIIDYAASLKFDSIIAVVDKRILASFNRYQWDFELLSNTTIETPEGNQVVGVRLKTDKDNLDRVIARATDLPTPIFAQKDTRKLVTEQRVSDINLVLRYDRYYKNR